MGRQSSTTNPTRIKTIARKDVAIAVEVRNGVRAFQVGRLSLEAYGLHPSDVVVVVATSGNTQHRVDLGSVAAWSREWHELSTLDPAGVLRFRLLVRSDTAPALKASAEGIQGRGGQLESLLPMTCVDLGQRLWDVVLDSDGAVLRCNLSVFPAPAAAEQFAPFRALVMPAALAQVLTYAAKHPEVLEHDGTDWQGWSDWLEELGCDPPPDDDEHHDDWVAEAVGRFCDRFRFADDFRAWTQASVEV